MAIEPKHRMDDLLRGYAQKRRHQFGAPMEVDRTTRNLLQSEVTRTLRNPIVEARPSLVRLPTWWPRLLWGGACAVAVVAAAGLWLWHDRQDDIVAAGRDDRSLDLFTQSRPENQPITPRTDANGLNERLSRFELGAVAEKQKTPAPQMAKDDKAPPPAAPSLPATAQDTVQLALSSSTSESAVNPDMFSNAPRFASGLTPKAAGAPPVPGESSSAGRRQSRYGAMPRPMAKGGPALQEASGPTPAANPTSPGLVALKSAPPSNGLVTLGDQNVASNIRFQQVDRRTRYRENRNSPPVPKVLTSFEMQMVGLNVRITEPDGSVYEGPVQQVAQQNQQQASERLVTRIQGRGQAPEPVPAPSGNFQNAPASSANGIAGIGPVLQQMSPATVPPGPNNIDNVAAEGFAFRVSGTNRTLNQKVLFTGEFQPGNGTTDLAQNVVAAGRQNQMQFGPQPNRGANSISTGNLMQRRFGQALAPSNQQTPRTQTVSQGNNLIPAPGRIEGRASVDGKDEFRVEALQVGP